MMNLRNDLKYYLAIVAVLLLANVVFLLAERAVHAQTELLPPIPARYDLDSYGIDPRVVAAFQQYPEAAICAAYDGLAAAQNWIDMEWVRHGLRTEKLDFRDLIEEHVRDAPVRDAESYLRVRAELQGITNSTDPLFFAKLRYLVTR